MLYNCYPIYYFISYHNLDHQLNNYFIFIIIMRIYLYHTYLIFFDFIHHNNLFISSHEIFLLRDYFIIIIIFDVKEIHFINLYFCYFLYSQYFLYFQYCQGNLKGVTMVIIKLIVIIIIFIIYLLIINFYFVQIILSLIQNFVVINF